MNTDTMYKDDNVQQNSSEYFLMIKNYVSTFSIYLYLKKTHNL